MLAIKVSDGNKTKMLMLLVVVVAA